MNSGGWRTIRQKIYSMIIAEIKFGRAVRCTYCTPPAHRPPIIDWFFWLGVFLQQEAIAVTCLLFFFKKNYFRSSTFTGLHFGYASS